MNELVPYKDLQSMAEAVVKGGLFPGVKTPAQAMTLFLIAQSEGLHPMTAALRYNIIKDRPAMKSDAMLASFMERGGTVDWQELTDEAVSGFFVSKGCPKGVLVRWTMADARRAGLVQQNQNYLKYPKQQLKARVSSDGVRMTDPAVNGGRHTPEEVQDFEPVPRVVPADIVAPEPPEEPTGPSELEGQLRRSLGETPEPVRLEGTVAPGHCTLKGCGGEIGLFISTSKAFPGREYWQCEVAHEKKIRLLNEGSTNKLANAAVAAHYREWADPWVGKILDAGLQGPPYSHMGAGDAASDPAAELPPPLPEDAPAPSIFDPEAITAKVAKKLAKEKAAAK